MQNKPMFNISFFLFLPFLVTNSYMKFVGMRVSCEALKVIYDKTGNILTIC